MPKRRVTATKRLREQAKRDRQQRKAERRANREAGQPEETGDQESYGNDATDG